MQYINRACEKHANVYFRKNITGVTHTKRIKSGSKPVKKDERERAEKKNKTPSKKTPLCLVFMSHIVEGIISFVPWTVGVASSSLTAYYGSHFVVSDLDTTHGTLSGASGSAILGVSAASMAVQAWAVFEWLKYAIKQSEGRISTRNHNAHYGRAMMVYWWLMFLFYLVAIASAAMNVELVTQFDNVNATVQGGKLGGTFGNATEGVAYACIGVGGMCLLTFLYAEFFARDVTEPHPTVIEAHGGH